MSEYLWDWCLFFLQQESVKLQNELSITLSISWVQVAAMHVILGQLLDTGDISVVKGNSVVASAIQRMLLVKLQVSTEITEQHKTLAISGCI